MMGMNPMQLMQMFKGGGNPQQLLQQFMNNPQVANNPMAKSAFEMLQKNDTEGLKEMAENLCKEKGTTPEQVKEIFSKQFGGI